MMFATYNDVCRYSLHVLALGLLSTYLMASVTILIVAQVTHAHAHIDMDLCGNVWAFDLCASLVALALTVDVAIRSILFFCCDCTCNDRPRRVTDVFLSLLHVGLCAFGLYVLSEPGALWQECAKGGNRAAGPEFELVGLFLVSLSISLLVLIFGTSCILSVGDFRCSNRLRPDAPCPALEPLVHDPV